MRPRETFDEAAIRHRRRSGLNTWALPVDKGGVSPSLRNPRRRHGSLQRSLLALVLVPVLGVVGLVGYVVQDSGRQVSAAEDAAEQVRAAVALDAVRGAVAQETVPTVGAIALAGVDATSSEIDYSGVSAQFVTALLTRQSATQRRTDVAVAETSSTPAAAEAVAAARRVTQLRAAGSGADVASVYGGYRTLVDQLAGQVDDHLEAAREQGLDERGATSIANLQLVSRAATLASNEVPLYLGALGAPPEIHDVTRVAFLSAWGSYDQASREMGARASADTAASWIAAIGTPAATTIDSTLAAAVLHETTPSLEQFTTLSTANSTRDAALRAVVTAAGSRAVTAARLPAEDARRALRTLLLVCAALVLVTLAATLLVRRSIAQPLRHLAEQADAVSAGELVDVSEGGPVEVRTVARGLAAAVDNLRRVRDQVQAVADGHVAADVVRRPLRGPLGEAVHASVTQLVTAIHEQERLRADLVHEATHDALTTLSNRAHVSVLIDRALRRSEDGRHRVALLFVDLDHFKAVNDSLGHAAGDELLRVVSARMRACTRDSDVVARLGGDEFLVLVEGVEPGPAGHDELLDLGRRLIATVSGPVELGGRSVCVGASVGVAVGVPGTGAEQLLHEADSAAYRAKRAGRGVVDVFDDRLRAELQSRSDLEAALRTGIADGELVLHYQPVLDLNTQRVTGVEALVRWQRPGHGLLPPDTFIPIAEASDLICELGRWALTEATAQLVRWDAEGGARAGLSVAVNVSGRHLAQPRLLSDVTTALAAACVDAGRLTIEITETVLVDEPLALGQLRALRALGVRIAIDDFGTGYTSVGQLSRLPVDVLKIDRSFVASTDAGHADIVRLVIRAAHSSSLGVVAEGVEEDSQLAALLEASCDSAQGYLFARPVPAAELLRGVNALAATV